MVAFGWTPNETDLALCVQTPLWLEMCDPTTVPLFDICDCASSFQSYHLWVTSCLTCNGENGTS